MAHLYPPIVCRQSIGKFFGDSDRAVLSSRASDRHRHMSPSFSNELILQKLEKGFNLIEIFFAFLMSQDIFFDLVVPTIPVSQGIDPERIGQETQVEHHIGIERNSVLVTERNHADFKWHHDSLAAILLHELFPQLMHICFRGVDNYVRPASQRTQHLPFPGDAFRDSAVTRHGMGPAGLLESAQERFIIGLQKKNSVRNLSSIHFLQRLVQILEELAAPYIYHGGQVIDFVVALRAELHHLEQK